MKKLLFFITSCAFSFFSIGQTASNFNTTDCASINHDLFTELNSGKVVVIIWVMPCASCISGALSVQSAVQSFSASNPGQVLFYVADDYGNSTCSTISTWCSTNGIMPSAKFTNSLVSMSPYGTAGMPKAVVLGDANHSVYYNVNGSGSITISGVQGAINNALFAILACVNENANTLFSSTKIFPNPANNTCSLNFNLAKDSKIKIEIVNQLGQKVSEVFNGSLQKGENTLNINTTELSSGNYFINFSDGESFKKLKLVIAR